MAGVVALASVGSLGQVWLLLLLAGLLLSIPLEIGLSSLGLGRRLRSLGLFLGQEEVQPPRVLQRQRTLRDEVRRNLHFHSRNEIFRRVVLDGALNEIHIGILQSQGLGREPWEQVEAIAQVGLYGGPEHLTPKDRLTLLSNQTAMRWLHRRAWEHWKAQSPQ